MEWQDIDTAPKDGTKVLGFDSGIQEFLVVWYEDNGWTGVMDDQRWMFFPTHWLPIPEAPQAG